MACGSEGQGHGREHRGRQGATAKAQADYQAKVQAHVQELQSQAQQLAASGDLTGAQAKASEIEQYTNDAKNVDPKTLVKTQKVTTGKTLTIGAIVSNSVYRDFAIVNDDLAEQIGNKQTMFVMQAFVTDKRGADTAQVKKALKKTIKKYYTIVVFDRDEYKSTMSSMIDQMLMVLYALLALSIIIAIFGIVNTLALSVSERTKEIGLLRAIGTSRGQVRGMLGIEAAIISVFGTVLGLVVGVAAGVVIRAVYASKGLETLAIPWLQLLVFLLLSIVVGLVSSISPASRALKQPVLDAWRASETVGAEHRKEAAMPIPNEIPVGARIVVRTLEGVDPTDHRMKFRDYVGHVRSWDGQKLEMTRDAAANGSRPEQRVTIPADEIVTIKPVPNVP